MDLLSLFSNRQVKKTWLIRIHRCYEATNLKCLPRVFRLKEALKENAEALSTEEPSQALWKRMMVCGDVGKTCCDIRKNYETLLIQMNRTSFCGSFFDDRIDIGLYSFKRGCCCNRMCLHYSLIVSLHKYAMSTYYLWNDVLYIEGSDRASSPCLSWQYSCATCFYLDFSLVWNLQSYPWHPLTPKYETKNHAHTHVILFEIANLSKFGADRIAD